MTELEQAVLRLQKGDQEAFDLIYRATRPVVAAVIRKYNRNQEDYEDIIQETYIKVHQNIRQLQEPGKVQPWINRIAANIAIRSNMKKNPALFSQLEGDEEDAPLEFEDENEAYNPEAVADKKAVAGIVDEIMNLLPEDQRTALWMVYGQGVKIREMAESLGVSENTIKSRLFQGKKKLLAMKGEFRRRGLEITAIPVGALLALSFQEDVYAAAPAAAAGMAAAAGAGKTTAASAAAAHTAGGLGTAGKAAAVITVGALIAVGGYYGLNRKPEAYDNQTNRQAVEAYRQALRNDEWYFTALNLDWYGEQLETDFAVADVNGDQVYEAFVHVPSNGFQGSTNNFFFYFADGELQTKRLRIGGGPYFGVIPGENRFLAGVRENGTSAYFGELYEFDGTKPEIIGDYYYDHAQAMIWDDETWENRANPTYLREREKGWAWEEQAEIYRLVEATEENLETYLGGTGMDTGLEDKESLGLAQSGTVGAGKEESGSVAPKEQDAQEGQESAGPCGYYVPGENFSIRNQEGLHYGFWKVEKAPDGTGYVVWRIEPGDSQAAYVEKLPDGIPVEWIPSHTYGGAGFLSYDGNRLLFEPEVGNDGQILYRAENFEKEYRQAVEDPYLGVYQMGEDTAYLYQMDGGYRILGRLPQYSRYGIEGKGDVLLARGELALEKQASPGTGLWLKGQWGDSEEEILQVSLRDGVMKYSWKQDGKTRRMVFQKTGDLPIFPEWEGEAFFDVEAEVNRIEGICRYTDQHLEQYEVVQDKRVAAIGLEEDEGCRIYYNEEGSPAKQVKRYDGEDGTVLVEVYYENPAVDGRMLWYPVLCRAVTEDGREYRIYWKDGGIIRYTAPDGETVDDPRGRVPDYFDDLILLDLKTQQVWLQMLVLGIDYFGWS